MQLLIIHFFKLNYVDMCVGVGLVGFFFVSLCMCVCFCFVVFFFPEKNFFLIIILNYYNGCLDIFKHPYSHSTFIKGYSSFF